MIIGKLNIPITYSMSFEEIAHEAIKGNRLARDNLIVNLTYKVLLQNNAKIHEKGSMGEEAARPDNMLPFN
jgi:hypothetical protein